MSSLAPDIIEAITRQPLIRKGVSLDLNNKSMEDCIALIAQTAEYANYCKALRTADNASPYEIPKADGELRFAHKQLRQLIEQAVISPKHITALISAIKVGLHR